MHGTAYANKAVIECDLIMAIGARWDDRITGKVSEFCLNATKIHIDIDPAEFGKIIQPDISVNGDAALVLDELIPLVKPLDTKEWLKKIENWKKKHPLKYPKRGGLRAQHVLAELDRLTGSNAIIATMSANTRCGLPNSADQPANANGCPAEELEPWDTDSPQLLERNLETQKIL